jgi:hypothetical protein
MINKTQLEEKGDAAAVYLLPLLEPESTLLGSKYRIPSPVDPFSFRRIQATPPIPNFSRQRFNSVLIFVLSHKFFPPFRFSE